MVAKQGQHSRSGGIVVSNLGRIELGESGRGCNYKVVEHGVYGAFGYCSMLCAVQHTPTIETFEARLRLSLFYRIISAKHRSDNPLASAVVLLSAKIAKIVSRPVTIPKQSSNTPLVPVRVAHISRL